MSRRKSWAYIVMKRADALSTQRPTLRPVMKSEWRLPASYDGTRLTGEVFQLLSLQIWNSSNEKLRLQFDPPTEVR